MGYAWDFGVVVRYLPELLGGLVNTLILSGAAIAGGLLVGLMLALARLCGVRALSWPARAVIEFMRATPPLVHLFWVFYALPQLTGIALSPFVAAWLALSIQSGAFFAEVFRAGIASVEAGQWEAARALGLPWTATMRRVVLPQAIRRMVTPFTERAFELAKTTTLAATLAYGELLYRAMTIASVTYRPLEVYTAVAALFFVVLTATSLGLRRIEARLRRFGA